MILALKQVTVLVKYSLPDALIQRSSSPSQFTVPEQSFASQV